MKDTDHEAADPNEYERQLDDAQLVAMMAHISERMQSLLSQGVPLPMGTIENHHLVGLLEVMVGRAKSLRVREWHAMWMDAQLDAAEAAVRSHLIGSGLLDGAP